MRPILLAALGLCVLVLVYSLAVEPNMVTLKSIDLRVAGFGEAPVRIIQISDVHLRSAGWRERRVARLARQASPDLIALTGDLVSVPDGVAAACRWAGGLVSVAPVYAVPGNYAYHVGGDEYLSRLDAAGIVVLRNRAVRLTVRGSRFWLLGVDDPSTTRSRLEDAVADVTDAAPKVLLAHFPTIVEQASYYGIELVLAGHTHGGQVRIPTLGAAFPFRSPLLEKYQKGLYQVNGTTMYVSSGIGTTGLPVRFLCPPEVVLLVLRGGEV
jgi:predicted MPP superfamily phosphohydrolase